MKHGPVLGAARRACAHRIPTRMLGRKLRILDHWRLPTLLHRRARSVGGNNASISLSGRLDAIWHTQSVGAAV